MFVRPSQKPSIPILYFVFAAQMFVVLMLAGLSFMIKPPPFMGGKFPFWAIFALLGAGQFLGAHAIALLSVKARGYVWENGRLVATGGPVDTATSYLSSRFARMVVCFAMMELIAVYGFISMFIGGSQSVAWVFIAVSATGLVSLLQRIQAISATHRALQSNAASPRG